MSLMCDYHVITVYCAHCFYVFSMYFIGVSGLRVLPLLINGWMDGLINVFNAFTEFVKTETLLSSVILKKYGVFACGEGFSLCPYIQVFLCTFRISP